MRRWLLLLLAVGWLAGQPLSAAAADASLADAHIHYSAPDWSVYSPDQVVAILDRAGITRALVSSTPDDGTLKLYDRDPKRVVPMLRPYRTRDDMSSWWRDPSIVPYLEQRLTRGVHKGIGEFHLHGSNNRNPVLKRITEIAVQRDLYLQAHSDDAAVIELFAIEPRSKIIWAHAGMSSGAAAVGALMDKQPNLLGRPLLSLRRRGARRHAGSGLARAPDPPRRPLHARQRHVDDVSVGAGSGHGRRRAPLPPAAPPRRRRKDRLQELRTPLPLALSA